MIDNGQTPLLAFVYRNPADAWFNGVLKRNQSADGHIVPDGVFANTHAVARDTFLKLVDEFGNKVQYIIKEVADGKSSEITIEELKNKPKYTKEQIKEAVNAESYSRARAILDGFEKSEQSGNIQRSDNQGNSADGRSAGGKDRAVSAEQQAKVIPQKTPKNSDIKLSAPGDRITDEQRRTILEAYDYAMNGDPVIELSGNEFQKDGIPLTKKVTEYYNKQFNGIAVHPELGEVKLDLEGVKDSLSHGIGKIKAAAYAAVPYLIEKGKIFNRENNWKNRGYDTVVMIAPLKISGIDYVGEVVVEQRPNRQGFYLHEVEIKEKLADVFKTPTQGGTSPVSKLIIAQWLEKVNPTLEKNLEKKFRRVEIIHSRRLW